MRKMTHGILWNLEFTHQDRSLSEINDEELVKSGYRVWIDFDQIHGNVMDAMAQAIEQYHIQLLYV